jgi:hypothetical protein
MRLNHQFDAAEWQSFDQMRLAQFGPGIAFSIPTQPSLPPPPQRAASFARSLRLNGFITFQLILVQEDRLPCHQEQDVHKQLVCWTSVLKLNH